VQHTGGIDALRRHKSGRKAIKPKAMKIIITDNDEVRLEIFEYEDRIMIAGIEAKKVGAGAKYIRRTLIEAMKKGKNVCLTVTPLSEDVTTDQLFAYYTDFGFKIIPGTNKMIRKFDQ